MLTLRALPCWSKGTIFAVFQTDGINTKENDCSNKYDSSPESDSDNFFKRIVYIGIPSGLMLRIGLRRVKTFHTVNIENVMLLIIIIIIITVVDTGGIAIIYNNAIVHLKDSTVSNTNQLNIMKDIFVASTVQFCLICCYLPPTTSCL